MKRYKHFFTSKKIAALIFLAILALAFNLRKFTFDLPHFRGDQSHYAALALKLDTDGIDGYNLRGVNLYESNESPNLIFLGRAEGKGGLLKGLERANITYYDEPLHHMPFGFPMALRMSHSIFAHGQPYSLLIADDAKIIKNAPPGVGLRDFRFAPAIAGKQFYAIIVPLFFSLLLIALVYFTSKTLYNEECAALTAMYLMAIAPIDILTSQKIWADDMCAALAAAGVLLFLLAVKKEKQIFALAAGVMCGASIITKQMGVIVAISIVAWHFIANIDRLFKRESFLKVVFDKNLMLFVLGGILSTGYWFFKITSVYGDPLYRPCQPGLAESAGTLWYQITQSRPRHLYLLGIPYQNPLFILAFISPIWLWLDKKRYKDHLFAVIWLAAAFFLSYNFFTGEHRYMLSAYPAFAILAGYVANRFRIRINRSAGSWTGTVLLITVLAASAFWSVPMALHALFHGSALILRPF